jgi:hypothetical protein
MVTANIPIACSLSSAELQQRRSELLLKIKSAVKEVQELEQGYLYLFHSTPEQLYELTNLIALEHACCPFLRFCLTVEPADGGLSLELTGPVGTKEFLATLFA